MPNPTHDSFPPLDLGRFTSICSTLTPAACDYYAEAASYCLESQSHQSGVVLSIRGDMQYNTSIHWPTLHPNVGITHTDEEQATENGATGIALGIVLLSKQWKSVSRACKGRGFDYWLGDHVDPNNLFQNKCRLEVSGIRNGTDAQVRYRMGEKLARLKRFQSNLPFVIIITEFSTPKSLVKI